MSTITATTRTRIDRIVHRGTSRPVAIAVAIGVALVVNLAIWLVGLAAGGSFEITDAGETVNVAPGGVVVLTVVPMLIGLTVAALMSLKWPGVIRVAQIVGTALALLTIGLTLTAGFDTASTIALSAMHVALVVPLVAGLEAMRR